MAIDIVLSILILSLAVHCTYAEGALTSDIKVNITCDNHLWFYADDQTVIEPTTSGAADWNDTNHVSVPSDTKVYKN
ncbi:hypothetical protein LSH36_2940g00002 [Paralvinella palmiformis]|uniref:Uncharacterized protein n=1 Tax=Paralvinella palmiformis TaxID=53620 RepID=A0AAD9MPS2_9ANNE|nr:hypothetical protein LSH36_2940g00002 [Paralvinella palmiformis]